MEKPSIEQVAWVFTHLCDHMNDGGSFRYLIYNRMGFGPEAYTTLYMAGGMALSNAFGELEDMREVIESLRRNDPELAKKVAEILRTGLEVVAPGQVGAPALDHPAIHRGDPEESPFPTQLLPSSIHNHRPGEGNPETCEACR